MPLSLAKTQAVAQLAEHIVDWLPGNPHPYADQSISFAGVAQRCGVGPFWPSGGSKGPSLRSLLERTLDREPKKFCTLVLEVVRVGIGYRSKKPITRKDVELLDQFVRQTGYGIKDLRDPAFLESLPTHSTTHTAPPVAPTPIATDIALPAASLQSLKEQLDALADLAPIVRGFQFERFLADLFASFALAPRTSFRIVGEQIDGSLELGGNSYLVEAKWQGAKIGQAELLIFSGKVAGKAQWARGILISYSGFSDDGLKAFANGKATNIICLDRDDLRFVLVGKATLPELLRRKARRAAEENIAFVSASVLF